MDRNQPRFVVVRPGRFGLWHRPPRRVIPHLASAGCTRIVTLLSEREGATEIGRLAADAGLQWTWLPLASGRPPLGRQNASVPAVLDALSLALDGGETLLIHCSAGMHRTGMVAYALLRRRGMTRDEALATIGEARVSTRQALTPAMLEWGDQWALVADTS
ncbi:MAG: protein-tyrosine phosphatase family protein [Acidobacteriota bacterium]